MRRTFILDTAQDLGNTCFSANVHQCDIALSVVLVQVSFKLFLFIIILLSYRPG